MINLIRLETARIFSSVGIPIRVILDSAVGAIMEQVDLCLVGAEGVMENGGIANKARKFLHNNNESRIFTSTSLLKIKIDRNISNGASGKSVTEALLCCSGILQIR